LPRDRKIRTSTLLLAMHGNSCLYHAICQLRQSGLFRYLVTGHRQGFATQRRVRVHQFSRDFGRYISVVFVEESSTQKACADEKNGAAVLAIESDKCYYDDDSSDCCGDGLHKRVDLAATEPRHSAQRDIAHGERNTHNQISRNSGRPPIVSCYLCRYVSQLLAWESGSSLVSLWLFIDSVAATFLLAFWYQESVRVEFMLEPRLADGKCSGD
jgi:hypothetical protein